MLESNGNGELVELIASDLKRGHEWVNLFYRENDFFIYERGFGLDAYYEARNLKKNIVYKLSSIRQQDAIDEFHKILEMSGQ
jgi:hypothetical protein